MGIVLRSSILRYIVVSLWRSRWPFILTILLFCVIEYEFSIISYLAFHDDYGFFCDSIISCIKVNIDQTFKQDGGAGGFLDGISEKIEEGGKKREEAVKKASGTTNSPATTPTASKLLLRLLEEKKDEPSERELKIWRVLFDNVFFFIAGIILIQVIQGIIIDTFATLREEEEKRNSDLASNCFICGIDRDTFDQNSGKNKGFDHHAANEHNLWNYIFFMSHLKSKSRTDYTGIESHVASQLRENQLSWFPINRALALVNVENDNEFDAAKNLQRLQAQIEEMETRVTQAEEILEKVTE
eukprot:TRINITY_DN10409_c0_g1_i3.p1 TRINITY_DN10409_c0_g1~~TRINITY_DN10409_c0_g1_i3.p1  ORF type:complete len:299 (+),score=84.07 TRINITY_DN10409_c0_g1_i3:34-930(+)